MREVAEITFNLTVFIRIEIRRILPKKTTKKDRK